MFHKMCRSFAKVSSRYGYRAENNALQVTGPRSTIKTGKVFVIEEFHLYWCNFQTHTQNGRHLRIENRLTSTVFEVILAAEDETLNYSFESRTFKNPKIKSFYISYYIGFLLYMLIHFPDSGLDKFIHNIFKFIVNISDCLTVHI